LAIDNAKAELRRAFAKSQSRKQTGGRGTDWHTELVKPLWPAAPTLVRQTKRSVGGVGAPQQRLGRSGAWIAFAGEGHGAVRADVITDLTRRVGENGRAAVARIDLASGCVALLRELAL
jgi:hypothetical protein